MNKPRKQNQVDLMKREIYYAEMRAELLKFLWSAVEGNTSDLRYNFDFDDDEEVYKILQRVLGKQHISLERLESITTEYAEKFRGKNHTQ